MVVGIGSALLIGSITGLLATKAKIPALLATLGMMGVARSGALYFSNGMTVSTQRAGLLIFSEARFIGIPLPFYVVFIGVMFMAFTLKYTRWGRGIYAVGGNEESAFYSGIRTSRIKMQLFIVASLFYGIGGMIYTGRLNSGNPSSSSCQ